MAITLASNLAPAGGKTFYLLEDIYLKGGLQVKDDTAARDLIALTNLKVGALVLTVADSKIWMVKTLTLPTLENPSVTPSVVWEEFLTNGGGGGGSLDDAPSDDKVYGRSNGQWVEVSAAGGVPGTFTRSVVIYTNSALTPGGTANFSLTMGASCIVFNLTLSRAVKISAFGTAAMDEVNPYTFLATPDHLSDDGSTMLFDGTVIRSRNYSILANMENPRNDKIYFTLESQDDSTDPVVVTMTYLPMELLSTTVPDSGTLPAPAATGTGTDSSSSSSSGTTNSGSTGA